MVVIAALMFVPFLSAEVRTAKEIAAVRAFNIEGVKLGMSKGEFLRLFPRAKDDRHGTNAAIGLTSLIVDRTAKTNGIDVRLLDGKVFDVFAFYSKEKLSDMGGVFALIKRLVAKLGKADADSPGKTEKGLALLWNFDEIDVFFKLSQTPLATAINYTDMEKWEEMQLRKQKAADPGF